MNLKNANSIHMLCQRNRIQRIYEGMNYIADLYQMNQMNKQQGTAAGTMTN